MVSEVTGIFAAMFHVLEKSAWEAVAKRNDFSRHKKTRPIVFDGRVLVFQGRLSHLLA